MKNMKNWQILCIVILLTTTIPVVGTAQSANTTANATRSPTTGIGTTAAKIEPSTPENTLATSGPTGSTTTFSRSHTRPLRSDQTRDDDPDNATPIKVGETVTGKLPVGDQDGTKFTLESGGRVMVSVTARNQTNMSAFLYGGEDLLESSFVDPGEQVSLTTTVDSGGQYYVFVRNEANDTPGSYAFTVSKSEPVTSGTLRKTAENTNSNGPGFGIFGASSAIVLLGYLLFRHRKRRKN